MTKRVLQRLSRSKPGSCVGWVRIVPAVTDLRVCFRVSMRLALASLIVWSAAADAGSFAATQLSADHKVLQLKGAGDAETSAPVLPDQVEFDSPLVSPDGTHAGWLALFSNCCTSYAVPLTLVVMDQQHHIQTFTGTGLPIFRWCFLPDSKSVAFMQTVLHGTNFERYEWRSLSDGRLLGEYEYPNEAAANALARKNAPAWVKCVPQ
jgi:hypothetical protein